MTIQRVIDTGLDVALYRTLFEHLYPGEEFEVDATVTEVNKYCFGSTVGVNTGMVQVDDGLLYHGTHFLDVTSVGYSEEYHGERIAMVAGKILIVLRKEL